MKACVGKFFTFVFCVIVSLSVAYPAAAWTKKLDFNDGATGEKTRGDDGFDDAYGGSYYDKEQSFEGGQSAKLTVTGGATAFGEWGGVISHPTNLRKGDEIWVRVRTFMPFGFNYNSTSEGAHLKFLRVHTSSASGSNQGYNDWYINPSNRVSGDNNGTHKFIFEGEQRWSDFGTEADRPQFGVWEVYEMYLKFDNVSTDNGGQALVRVWKNGVLKGEFTNRRTLSNSDSYSDRTHIFTYWNGGAPKTQHMWLDDVVVTSDTPDAVDSHGNPYVGAGDFRALNPPISPPSFTQNVK